MDRHLARNTIRRSKRQLFLSPSLHHIRHGKQPQQQALNQNRSISPIHMHQQFRSCASLNSYLSEKDFLELRQALKIVFHYIQSKNPRLTSPYLQQQLDNDDQSFLPLYTNEYFIRNGLLNHNDGPEIQSTNLCYSSSSPSSMNISLPLALLSNPNYLFTALTNNFTSKKYRDEDESESMMIRRYKVQTWERDNILQQHQASEYHRSSIHRTSSTAQDDKTMEITDESISSQACIEEEPNQKLLKFKNTDDLFPMIKVLAPYIIIRDSLHLRSNSIQSTNTDNQNNEKSVQHVNHLTTVSEKQSLHQIRQITNDERLQQRKRNYLLAEFESVLTQISKKQFL